MVFVGLVLLILIVMGMKVAVLECVKVRQGALLNFSVVLKHAWKVSVVLAKLMTIVDSMVTVLSAAWVCANARFSAMMLPLVVIKDVLISSVRHAKVMINAQEVGMTRTFVIQDLVK